MELKVGGRAEEGYLGLIESEGGVYKEQYHAEIGFEA